MNAQHRGRPPQQPGQAILYGGRTMRIQSLGGLTLEGSALRRPKPLTLLVYLALEGRQDRRFLAELFWPRAADPRKSLTVALARLRAAVPDAIDADRTQVGTRASIDVHELLEALEEGRADQALALYRGPFMHGVTLPGIGPELEEWVFRTREFAAGRVALTLLELAELEASTRGARGARARAEAAYRVSDVSHLPAHDLTRLHGVLVSAGSPLARPLRAEAHELGVPLEEAPTESARTRATTSPVTSADALPPAVAHATRRPWRAAGALIGRSDELDAAMTLLRARDGRLLSVTGPPGVGKSSLALELARRLTEDGDTEDVHFVTLEHLDQPDALGACIAEALGLGSAAGHEAWARVVRAIGDRREVLLLDNVEQLVSAAPQLVDLLAACPNLRIVVTSRRRLNVMAERVLPLDGLSCAATAPDDPGHASANDAVRLFVLSARRHRPNLVLDEAAMASVLDICRSTGGLPLALELAAAWARALPVDEIATELERDLTLLDHDAADLPERQRGMRAAIDASWRLLSPRDRAAMMRLAVFAGDFDRQAAAAVADVSATRLAALLDASLLRWDGHKRYDFHPLIRRFARERARDEPELLHDAEQRHASYFLGRLAEHPQAVRRAAAVAASSGLRHDLENAVAAWRWALGERRRDLLEAAVEPLGWLLYSRGRPRLGLELMEAAEPYCGSGAAARFRTMYLVAEGRASEAVALMERTLERVPAPAPLERAHQLRVLGVARLDVPQQDRAASERDFREALDLYQRANDPEGVAMMLNNLANTAPDPHVGLALARGAERAAERADEHHARAMALTTQAALQLWFTGAYRAAAEAAEEAAVLHERSGFDVQTPWASLLRAEANLALGELERVECDVRALAVAAGRAHHAFAADWRAAGLALRARVARLTGDRATASAHAHACLAETDAVGGNAHASAHLLIAMLALEEGRFEDADAALARLPKAPTGGWAAGLATPEAVLAADRSCAAAAVVAARGRVDEAASRLRAALVAAQRARAFPSWLMLAATLATLQLRQGRAVEANRLRDLVATHPATHAETRATLAHVSRPGARAVSAAPPPSERDAVWPPATLEDLVRRLLDPESTS